MTIHKCREAIKPDVLWQENFRVNEIFLRKLEISIFYIAFISNFHIVSEVKAL